jgi:DNA-binding beta-propeller fold protein YncE
MKIHTLVFALALALGLAPARAAEPEQHYLYLTTPDGAQVGGTGDGILIFDIDHGHRLVRRVNIPAFHPGLRGFCANAQTRCAYYSAEKGLLGAFNLETEKIIWEQHYDAGVDRAAITPDGSKIYAPSGFWANKGAEWLVIDAKEGAILKRIKVRGSPHNTICTLDGQFALLGSTETLTLVRVSDDTIVRRFNPIGGGGVFPFTVDSSNHYAYVCLGGLVGFDIADLQSGQVLQRVLAGDGSLKRRTHGIALTPDEKELWIADPYGKKLWIFDATVMPPSPKDSVELSAGGHGWVTFSLDGRFAWTHTPDVIDVRTRRLAATLKDENGKPVAGSKFMEVHFRNGKVTGVGDQFGLGRAHVP